MLIECRTCLSDPKAGLSERYETEEQLARIREPDRFAFRFLHKDRIPQRLEGNRVRLLCPLNVTHTDTNVVDHFLQATVR